ncbi:YitT family protein [Pallidibacillus thermolactis]|uniref:YitT family protein n=1 Tax=Pallidibacillus thermolactis TaxID=251051 RepID=UPI0021D8F909|nr:YitT family protein [Pallidibacillus thermolactis]MCU9599815.1 YitT family protein [Pallidibacillus thermolactis subsp. kokeshiiformis]
MSQNIKVKNIFVILIGTSIFSFGLVHFNMENNLAEGGFTGITLLLYFLFKSNPSISNLILNVPIFFIGWKVLGRAAFIYTVIGSISLSFFLEVFQRYKIEIPLGNDMLLISIIAGIFIGFGLGIVFRAGGTTGGSDIVARLVNKFFGLPMGKTMFLFDAAVITLSLLTYLTLQQGIYTLIAVFIGAKIIDFIQEGAYSGRGAIIISKHYEKIAKQIMIELDRGITILDGEGFFTQEKKKVLYCVVGKRQINQVKRIALTIDPYAFVSITHVHEVIGEGFTLDKEK